VTQVLFPYRLKVLEGISSVTALLWDAEPKFPSLERVTSPNLLLLAEFKFKEVLKFLYFPIKWVFGAILVLSALTPLLAGA
jgi:hypothetical protein